MKRRGRVIPFPKLPPEAARPAEASALVEVRRCRDQAEALVVRALLESEGIAAVLRGGLVHSVHPFSVGDQAAVALLVATVQAARARAILAGRRRPARKLLNPGQAAHRSGILRRPDPPQS
jgi:hypothetical protein